MVLVCDALSLLEPAQGKLTPSPYPSPDRTAIYCALWIFSYIPGAHFDSNIFGTLAMTGALNG
jgi:hypothetical protein